MKKLLLVILLFTSTSLQANKLATPSYEIEIGSCPEGYVSCKAIKFKTHHLKSGKVSYYQGETMHSLCKDNVTACQFRGYQFVGDIGQFVINTDGTLEINDESSQAILVEKGQWLDSQKPVSLLINSEQEAWAAIQDILKVQSCLSAYGFEQQATDMGEYWLLESEDENPNINSCRKTKIQVNKKTGKLTYF